MTIIVTQTESESASQRITLLANSQIVGAIGPGESLTIKTDSPSCVVDAVCGSYKESITLTHDENLTIRWVLSARRMELVPVRK